MAEERKSPYSILLHKYNSSTQSTLPFAEASANPEKLKDQFDNTGYKLYDGPDAFYTYNRVLGQVRNHQTNQKDNDTFTELTSSDPKISAPLIGAGTLALGTFAFVLQELQEISKERNTDIPTMFSVFRKHLDKIVANNSKNAADWVEKFNEYLKKINNDKLSLKLEINAQYELYLEITSNLDGEEKPKSKPTSWEKIKNYVEKVWDIFYIAPLTYWIVWAGATLVTGAIVSSISASFGLAVAFGFGVPLFFAAIYFTLVSVDYLNDKIKNSKTWEGYYRTFFKSTEISESQHIGKRVVSAFFNFGRYALGALAFLFVLPIALIQASRSHKKPTNSGYILLDSGIDSHIKKSKTYHPNSELANHIREAFRKIMILIHYENISKKYETSNFSSVNISQVNLDLIKQSSSDQNLKLPNVYLHTLLNFIPTFFSLTAGVVFMSWFAIDSAFLFGTTIASTVLFPLGIVLLTGAFIATLVKSYEFLEALKKKNANYPEEYKQFQKKENHLHQLQNEFYDLIKKLPLAEAQRLKKYADQLPDFKNSGIFKDIENTSNDKPWYEKAQFWLATMISFGSGALLFRIFGVEGTANGILPYAALTAGKVAGFFGVSTLAGGWILFASIIMAAIIFAVIKYTVKNYNSQYEAIKPFTNTDSSETRMFALDKQIAFYSAKIEELRKDLQNKENLHLIADGKNKENNDAVEIRTLSNGGTKTPQTDALQRSHSGFFPGDEKEKLQQGVGADQENGAKGSPITVLPNVPGMVLES